MRRRRPNGTTGISRAKRRIDPSSIPSTHDRARQIGAQGPSVSSRLQRALYWQIRDEHEQQATEQAQQQTAASVSADEVLPSWNGAPTPIATANLFTAPNGGQAAGSALVGGDDIPAGYLPPVERPQ